MKSVRGSLWKKWDLHVHTPASLVQDYGGNTDDVWDKFVSALENLPKEFKVIGVNDYLFIEGYRKLRKVKENGRLKNIELLLPVIELRLNKFAGTESKLSRVNFHVIFSDELEPDVIESQFIAALTSKYELNPKYTKLARNWSASPTRPSLEALGKLIIDSVPSRERQKFGSPLEEGFNNLNFDINYVNEILKRPQFEGKHLTGIGKTEWAGIKWNNQSIADKKTIINTVDMVFTACENVDVWARGYASLKVDNVNCHLLDCSDSHRFSFSKEKDRLGRCLTWINADTTFLGLRFALRSFEDRVFIGTSPEIIERVKSKGLRYIDALNIQKISGSKLQEIWFNAALEFNYGLVALIGNKGSGKSALAESIGLIGNTKHFADFSFLNELKFKKKSDNKAQHFEATLTWANKQKASCKLSDSIKPDEAELVQFIPQRFLENICNEVPAGEDNDFEKELRRVIFSHIDIADRQGQTCFEDLLQVVTRAIGEGIDQLRNDVQDINRQIVSFENECSEQYRMKLEAQYRDRQQQLRDLNASRPKRVAGSVIPEANEISAKIKLLRTRVQVIDDATENKKNELARLHLSLNSLDSFEQEIQTLKHSLEKIRARYEKSLSDLGLEFGNIAKLVLNESIIIAKKDELNRRVQKLEMHLGLDKENPNNSKTTPNVKSNNLPKLKDKTLKEIAFLQLKLDEPQKLYQTYVGILDTWSEQKRELKGDKDKPDSLLFLDWKLKDLRNVPNRLIKAKQKRLELSKEIHQRLKKLCAEYGRLHKDIQEYVDNQTSAHEIQLNFSVGLVVEDFQNAFIEFIKRHISSSFALEEGQRFLKNLIGTCNFDDETSVLNFITRIDESLHINVQTEESVDIDGLLRKGKTRQELYDYLFGLSYIRPIYMLKFDSKQLNELSPGEKGTVLLIFYLLVDKSETPLVIDQPEDNLDNETIVKVLVNCIKEARKRRQIFIVTHNPNLAVVCDADQIILCSIDKENGNRVTYISGALENSDINPHVIDILEGTKPAFDKRADSYIAPSLIHSSN